MPFFVSCFASVFFLAFFKGDCFLGPERLGGVGLFSFGLFFFLSFLQPAVLLGLFSFGWAGEEMAASGAVERGERLAVSSTGWVGEES